MDLEAYCRSHDHRRHGPGAPMSDEWLHWQRRLGEELKRVHDAAPARVATDRAWIVMLLKQGIIYHDVAKPGARGH